MSVKNFSFNTMSSNQRGFTFIEILMTLAIIAILFVPVMQLFSDSLFATTQSLEMITATNLAKSHMEKTINLNLTKTQLREQGEQFFPPLDQKAFEINGSRWRVKREPVEGTDPLEVRIHVFHAEDVESDPNLPQETQTNKKEAKPVVSLVTLIEDTVWGSIKPGSETEIQE